MAAVLDPVPVVGAAAVALSVSVTVCLSVLGVLTVYKIIEDYLLLPKIIGRIVAVPAVITVVAVLLVARWRASRVRWSRSPCPPSPCWSYER